MFVYQWRVIWSSFVLRFRIFTLIAKNVDCKTVYILFSTAALRDHVCNIYYVNSSGPFCQRVLLTIEEKHLPYDMKLVDLGNKPEW